MRTGGQKPPVAGGASALVAGNVKSKKCLDVVGIDEIVMAGTCRAGKDAAAGMHNCWRLKHAEDRRRPSCRCRLGKC